MRAHRSPRGARRPSLVGLAGVDASILEAEHSQTERGFYNRLGFSVLMTATVSSLALLVSLGYVLRKPATDLWPIAFLWFVVILNVDVLLQSLVTARRIWVAAIPRVLVTLVLGVLISEPLLLVINGPEISRALAAETQTSIEQSGGSIESFYQPQIMTATEGVAALQDQVAAIREAIIQDTYVANCEAGDPACSLTHRAGCGPVCTHYQQLARLEQSRLASVLPLNRASISRLEVTIATLTEQERQALEVSRVSTRDGNGFIAREEILSHLMASSTPVLYEVWLLRAAFWLLDLLPLLLAYVHVSLGSSAYVSILAARRRQEALRAHAIDSATKVEHTRIDEQADADIEANRVRIWADRDRRIRESDRMYAWDGPPGPVSHAPSIPAMSLSDLVGSDWKTHESQAVQVPPALRRAGWIGTALVTSLSLVATLLSSLAGVVIAGAWLVDIALVAVLGIAAYTRGFTRANRWALYATFGIFVAGLALPLWIVLMSL